MTQSVDAPSDSATSDSRLSVESWQLVRRTEGILSTLETRRGVSTADREMPTSERSAVSPALMILQAESGDDWERIVRVLTGPPLLGPTILIARTSQAIPAETWDMLEHIGRPWTVCREDQLESRIAERFVDEETALIVVTEEPLGHLAADRSGGGNSLKQGIPRRHNVSPATARDDRAAIWSKSFRADARRWISKYSEVGDRDPYLWQWCLHGIELTTLPCVLDERRAALHDTKLLSVVLCVLFDDVADRGRNPLWLDALFKTVQGPPCQEMEPRFTECQAHLRVTRELWNDYQTRVSGLPDFAALEPVWRFDIDQFFTAMKYAQLVNSMPELSNPTEHDVYTPHNMLMVSFGTLDLMCSPGVDAGDKGAIRETLWHIQAMGRVGNVLSTWRRELRESDRSNGLIARALAEGLLSLKELDSLTPEELERKLKRTHLEQELAEKWERHRRLSRRCAAKVRSIDMEQVLDAHDRFLEMHLGSIGMI